MEVLLYNSQGKVYHRATMKDVQTLNGKLIYWYDDGQKLSELSVHNNYSQGKAMAWWPTGTVREKVDFDTNTFEYFNEKGKRLIAPKERYFQFARDTRLDVSQYFDNVYFLEKAVNNRLQ